ncbi:MAG: hypothetical protein M5U07_17180 [Xanthobacteraceae bacterium]|nr:hypothetical protein [Xanthobacteraceae bacterium]
MDAPRDRAFDAAALKREFPGLADPGLHYLDNAATAQMPEVVLAALRRFRDRGARQCPRMRAPARPRGDRGL